MRKHVDEYWSGICLQEWNRYREPRYEEVLREVKLILLGTTIKVTGLDLREGAPLLGFVYRNNTHNQT